MSTPDFTTLPSYTSLPPYSSTLPGCAWSVFGAPPDELGTLNLLTPSLTLSAMKEEVKEGKGISLNWEMGNPLRPMYGRRSLEHRVKESGRGTMDDEIHINTQSGTQWDGLKHFGVLEDGVHYGGVKNSDLSKGLIPPLHTDNPLLKSDNIAKLGVQNYANHGICGRAVLLDLPSYFLSTSTSSPPSLPYDPWTSHPISSSTLLSCASFQNNTTFRRGDILLIRVGFMKRWREASAEERDELGGKEERFAGLEQSEDVKRFLWDEHFAAVASDQPALERWPTPEGTPHLHQTLLGLWGMPIGEMFQLEELAEECKKRGRWSCFLSSWPLNLVGGCASPANAAAFI